MGSDNRLTPYIAAAIAVALGSACSVDVLPLECVADDECGSGAMCVAGTCTTDTADLGLDVVDDSGVDLADTGTAPCPTADCLDPLGIDDNDDGVDGVRAAMVFVDASNGDDEGPGTADAPVATLARAVALAAEGGRDTIALTAEEHVLLGETLVVSGARFELGGGYERDGANWTRADGASSIRGANPALDLSGVDDVRLVGVEVFGAIGSASPGSNRLGDGQAGESSVAVVASGGVLYIEDSTLMGGAGGRGGDGEPGVRGPDGGDGGDGGEACVACDSVRGGSSGEASCQNVGFDGGTGGAGAADGVRPQGEPGAGEAGGGGGVTGDPDGEDGDPGEGGEDGMGGGPHGYVRIGTWFASPGERGRAGSAGSGGGGGAGGVGLVAGSRGGGGGGGGSGGCPGSGGGGGGGGGGSIGLLATDVAITLVDATLGGTTGGDGGSGSQGGDGGAGGMGGAGSAGIGSDVGTGGDGGQGGAGGSGGRGGGGGGGVSVGLVAVGDTTIVMDEGSRLEGGDGGAGGSGGGANANGMQGFAGPMLVFGASDETCPAGAAPVGGQAASICVDRYEASANGHVPVADRPDNGVQAASVPDELPWLELSRTQAERACRRAGGDLCGVAALQSACTLSSLDPVTCNVAQEGPLPSGSRPGCVGSPGIFDLIGNAWEWTAEESPTVFGGGYDTEAGFAGCDAAVDFAAEGGESVGFRCCVLPSALSARE